MYRKILSWILVFVMVFAAFGGITKAAYAQVDPECKIGEVSYENIGEAVIASVDGDVITLLKDVSYNGKISVISKKITLNLDGYNLNVSNTGDTTVEVGLGGEIDLIGDGEFNVSGTGLATIGYYDNRGTITINNGKVEVTNVYSYGDSGYPAYGIYVSEGSINVLNNVEVTGLKRAGVYTTGINSSATVNNNVKSSIGAAIQLYDNSNITVYGNVEGGYGVDANNSTAVVKGDAIGVSDGARAMSGAQVYIGGNATSSANNSYGAYSTQENSFVSVSGSAISYGDYSRGTFAGAGAEALIMGNSESRGNDGDGVYTTYNSEVKIKGDIISENGTGVWAWHYDSDKPSVTVDGEIVAETFIEFDRNENITVYDKDEYTSPTTKEGYFTYTDGYSTVWVSYPDVWGIEIESTDMYPFDGGDGSSEETVFEISTANQLSQLAYNVNNGNNYSGKYFKLTSDIDLSGKEWVPIGSLENNYFDGYFNGNNKTIEGLEIGSSTQVKSYYASGLFGVISSNSVIENLNLLNVIIYSNTNIGTGALVGYNSGGEIDYCGSSGNINAYSVLGGLVGRNTGNIENSYSRVNLTSDRSVSGGFVGDNTDGMIFNSYATGNVVSGAYPHAGGFVGYISGNSIIQNCYATGDVSGSAWGYIGGFYGRYYSGGSLTNTYWNQDAQIVALEYHGYVPFIHGSSQSCLGVSESEMKNERFASLLNSTLPIPTTDYYNWEIQEGLNQGFPVHGSLSGINPEEPTTTTRPSVPRLEIETEVLKDGVENEEYELQVEGDGGKSPYIWSAEGLPKGLSISEEGMIFGTPEEAGDFSVKIELIDSRNYYRSGIFSLKITKDESESEDTKEEDSMEDPFSDIDEHWAEDYIKGIMEKNIINGYPDGTFKPDNNVTREEFASLLVRALQLEKYSDTTFEDILDRWSTEDISTAAYYEIIKGYDENKFGPEDFITREQMAVMIARALDLEETSGVVDLNDIQNASSWARDSIVAVVNEGLIEGYPDGSFKPMNNLTRAEAVKVIYSIMK